MTRSRPVYLKAADDGTFVGPGTPRELTEQVVQDLAGRLVKAYSVKGTRYVGRLHSLHEGVLRLLDSAGHLTMSLPWFEVDQVQEMPDVGRDQIREVLQNARIHYDSAADSVTRGDFEHWTVRACVQDVRELADLIEVMDSSYGD